MPEVELAGEESDMKNTAYLKGRITTLENKIAKTTAFLEREEPGTDVGRMLAGLAQDRALLAQHKADLLKLTIDVE